MKNTALSAAIALACALPTYATAAPFCAELMDKNALPKSYVKRGPFYSDQSSGWIVGADQLKSTFEVTDEVRMLWRELRAEFEARGARLVVLSAPPRPLFLPEEAVDALDLPASFDRDAMARDYSAYIAALNAEGLAAPDLSDLVRNAEGTAFYFQRDTHWTPIGAALSAAYLAAHMTGAPQPKLGEALITSEQYAEKGSLSTVVEETCGARPAPEAVPAPSFSTKGDALSLLGETNSSTKVALVGTSFSDRYERDAYRVADALAHSLDASVENYSISGGGLTVAMSRFLTVARDNLYDTVIWEAPYTSPLVQVHGLRQVLGMLQAQRLRESVARIDQTVSDDWVSVPHGFSTQDVHLLEIETPGTNTGKLSVELITRQGDKHRFKLEKSKRLAAKDRTTQWSLSLTGLPAVEIERIKLRLSGQGETAATVRLF